MKGERMQYLKEAPKRFLMDGCKMAWYGDKLQKFMRGERIAPITLDMGIHKGCNMRCIFCYGTYQKPSNDYIPTDKLLGIAKDAGDLGIKSICIIGDGEPTMNKGLYPFVEALTNNNVESGLATNGLLLDDTKVELLTKNCTWIRFTICATGEKYRQIHTNTPKGSFEKIKNIISHSVKHKRKCTIGLQMVLVPECFDQVIPLAQLGIDLGVDYVQIKQFSDAGAGMPLHFDMNLYDQMQLDLKKAEQMSTDVTEIIIKWKAMEESKNVTMNKKWSFDRCIDLPFLFQISGNGKCYPCGYLFNKEEYCYGDLTKQRLSEILNSGQYWNIINKIAKMDLKDLCTGQCRHSANLEFMDQFIKLYKGNAKETIIELCGGEDNYKKHMENPPEHLSFI
jgi:radical SAM protein with 4Fe4S-binding SPASM domain